MEYFSGTRSKISMLLKQAESKLHAAQNRHELTVHSAETKLHKANAREAACQAAAVKASDECRRLEEAKKHVTGKTAKQLAGVMKAAKSAQKRAEANKRAATRATNLAKAELQTAQSPFQEEIDHHLAMLDLQSAFEAEYNKLCSERDRESASRESAVVYTMLLAGSET